MKRVILAIDTCGPVLGVALASDGATRTRTARVGRGAEGLLIPWSLELCQEAGCTLRDLTGVGVAVGPGAFTGLRVGVATACGIAQALQIPVYEGNSLVSRALAAGLSEPVLAMLDARKGRVYAAWVGPEGEVLRGPDDVSPQDALSWPGAPGFWATGEGTLAWRALCEQAGARICPQAEESGVGALARLTEAAILVGQTVEAVAVRPRYIRPADAIPRSER